jgi:hypothetical protein
MDDLDRLAFRLARTIRQKFPQLREHGFSLTDLEETLLPFRDARRELADTGTDAWEISMLRLVSGERGYLETNDALRDACRNALTLPSPTMALVRSWASSSLSLGPAALRVGDERNSGPVAAAATPQQQHARPASPVAGSGRLAEAPPTAQPQSATPPRSSKHQGCRYCGGRLPDGRTVTFCPHCGLDLTKRQCPACSSRLEVQWRFCVTCGRSAELPDFPILVAKAIPLAS